MSSGEYRNQPIIDPGNAPEVFCYGVAKVERIGTIARFHMFTPHIIGMTYRRVINLHLNMPVESIPAGMEMTIGAFETELAQPIAGRIIGKLAN